MISSAEGICQGEQIGELRYANGLRDYVVLVNWVFVPGTTAVTDIILKDEAVEPSSGLAAVFRAVCGGETG